MNTANNQTNQNKEKSLSNSKFGYAIILFCSLVVCGSIIISQQITARAIVQPTFIPADALKVSAESTSWVCPVASGSIVLLNPDTTREASVNVYSYNASGNIEGKVNLKLKKYSVNTIEQAQINSNDASMIYVESFDSSVLAYRNEKLIDGQETIPCINDLSPRFDFTNIETVRNAGATLVLANPYDEAVVVDISASLVNSASVPPLTLSDEKRGEIIPAHGKTSIDLQAEFGRYSLMSLTVKSRSGFYAAEVLQTYNGANGVNGQTILSSASNLTSENKLIWPGVSPTRVSVVNNSFNTHSVSMTSYGVDKRSITSEDQLVSAGATLPLTIVGDDYGPRLMTLNLEKGNTTANNIYSSWIFAKGESVSSGTGIGKAIKRGVVSAQSGDVLHLFNPSKKEAKVSYAEIEGNITKQVTLKPGEYKDIQLANSTLLIEVFSNRGIVFSTSDFELSHYSKPIEIIP